MRISDELLEKFGIYYNSEFVEKCLPHIRQLPFAVWVRMEIEKREGRQAA